MIRNMQIRAQTCIYFVIKISILCFLLLYLQYSGTNAEFTKADTVIFRTDLYNITAKRLEYKFKRTLKYDSKWLDSKYLIFYLSDFILYFYYLAFFLDSVWFIKTKRVLEYDLQQED